MELHGNEMSAFCLRKECKQTFTLREVAFDTDSRDATPADVSLAGWLPVTGAIGRARLLEP